MFKNFFLVGSLAFSMNSFATYILDCNGEGVAGTSEDLEAALAWASQLNAGNHNCEVCGGPSAFVGDLGSEKKDTGLQLGISLQASAKFKATEATETYDASRSVIEQKFEDEDEEYLKWWRLDAARCFLGGGFYNNNGGNWFCDHSLDAIKR